MLKIRAISGDNGVKILELSGSLDATSSSQLEAEGMEMISKGCKSLLLDFAGLNYLSSAGLRAILGIAKKIMPNGGRLAIFSAVGLTKDVLSMSGFEMFIPVKTTREEAIAACVAVKEAGK